MNNIKFIDDFFKFLILLFWPIVWYKYVSIPQLEIEIAMCFIFAVLSIVYIALIILNKNKFNLITIVYRISNLITFMIFLISYIFFPKNITLLFLKLLFIGVYLYISCLKNFKYEMNEGIVGILSGLLLLTITFFY